MRWQKVFLIKYVPLLLLFYLYFCTQPQDDIILRKGSYSKRLINQPAFTDSPLHNQNESIYSHTRPMFILLLSSSGRSGSTLITELLKTLDKSVAFFEPLFYRENDPCIINGTCVPDLLAKTALCHYSQEFEERFKRHNVFYRYYHENVNNCLQRSKEKRDLCKLIDIRSMCLRADVRIIKVIRSRLSWVEQLLKMDSLNIKIIHLIRDPRASLNSIRRTGWPFHSDRICFDLKDDLQAFEKLVKLYPEKVFQLRYEKMCTDLTNVLSQLVFFLSGKSTIPDRMAEFIRKHMNTSTSHRSYVMNTEANSSKEYQAWRWQISKELLLELEREPSCLFVIQKLGHRIFGSLEYVQNTDLSLNVFGH